MSKIPLLVKVLLGLTATAVAAAFFIHSQQGRLRACGHPRDLLWEINPFHATHCCTSGRAVSELAMLYYAQKIYHDEHGTYATSFAQLTNEFSHRSDNYAFYLESDGSRWSIVVPLQVTLAGSYLLTDSGKLYFRTNGTVTTNDIMLSDLSR